MNLREIPQEQLPKPLQSYLDEKGVARYSGYWPGFGWEGTCVDSAIAADAVPAMQWCHDNAIVNHDTKNFYDKPLRRYCEERGATGCAKLLKSLGYPLLSPK